MTILEFYKTVKEEVDKFDAMGLLKNGASDSTYELLATNITSKISKGMTVNAIAEVMANAVNEHFDTDYDEVRFIGNATIIRRALDEVE